MLILANADSKGEWVAEMIKEGIEHLCFWYTKEQVNASKKRFCNLKPEVSLKKALNAIVRTGQSMVSLRNT